MIDIKLLHISESYPLKKQLYLGIFVRNLIQAFNNYNSTIENFVLVPLRIVPSRKMINDFLRELPKYVEVLTHPAILNEFGIIIQFLKYISPFRKGVPLCADGIWFYNIHKNKIAKFIAKNNPDLILAHFIPVAGTIALKIKRTFGIPYACFVHEDPTRYDKNNFENYIQIIEILANAKFLIVNSTQTKRKIEYFIQDKDIYIINLGAEINSSMIVPITNRSSGSVVRIISVGNLIDAKGFLDLIDTCKVLKEKYNTKNRWRLDIYGDGPRKQFYIKKIRDLNLEENVFISGSKEQSRLYEEYRNSDLFVLLSHHDSYGVAYIEALASGCVVIGTPEVGCIEEILKLDHDIITVVVPSNHDTIASALANFIDNENLRNNLSERGKILAATHYSWKSCVETINSLGIFST